MNTCRQLIGKPRRDGTPPRRCTRKALWRVMVEVDSGEKSLTREHFGKLGEHDYCTQHRNKLAEKHPQRFDDDLIFVRIK